MRAEDVLAMCQSDEQRAAVKAQLDELDAPAPKRSKYGNTRVKADGFTFDSKKEAAYYHGLKARQASGDISFFLCQVPFRLPGGVTYRADFMVFYPDGRFEVVDVKGKKTAMYATKKKMVEDLYPIKIKEV